MTVLRFLRFVAVGALVWVSGCGKLPTVGGTTAASPAASTYIYVASGSTYAGNTTPMSAPSQTIVKYNSDGTFNALIRDYSASPGDTPVGLVNFDDKNILVMVENAAGRRIEKVSKDGMSLTTFLTNAAGLNGVTRALFAMPDGYLVSKTTAIEKFSTAGTRILVGGNPYVNAPAAPCSVATTLIPKMALGPSNNIFMLHAAATPNNKIDIINSTGYAVAGDCLAGIAAPSVNHYPTSILYHSSGKMLVGFGNDAVVTHQIYSYDVTANTMVNPILAYNDLSVMQGAAAMAEMPDASILIAGSSSVFNTIEKYTLSAGVLTRATSTPFIGPSVYTRSTSAILVAD